MPDLHGRKCVGHVALLLSQQHPRRILNDYLSHYRWRCHRRLEMDRPAPWPVLPPEVGGVVEVQEAGAQSRRYKRVAACAKD